MEADTGNSDSDVVSNKSVSFGISVSRSKKLLEISSQIHHGSPKHVRLLQNIEVSGISSPSCQKE